MADKEATLWLKIKALGQDVLDRVVITMGDIVDAAKWLGRQISNVVLAYREQEEAVNALNQAMVQAGIFSTQLRDSYLAQASALQKLTLYGDEQIIAAQAALTQQLGQIPITQELTKAVLDYATATKSDAVSAAIGLGKALDGSSRALQMYGIEVNEKGTRTEKLAQIIDGVNKKFGGQAEAAAQDLGVLQRLKNAVSDTAENLGQQLKPAVEDVSTAILNQVIAINESEKAWQGVRAVIDFVRGVIYDLKIALDFINTAFLTIIQTIGLVTDVINVNRIATDDYGKSIDERLTAIGQMWKDFGNNTKKNVADFNDNILILQAQAQAREERLLMESLAKKAKVIEDENNKIAVVEKQRLVDRQKAEFDILEADHQMKLAQLFVHEQEKLMAINAAEMAKVEAEIGFQEMRLQNASTNAEKIAALDQIAKNNTKKRELEETKFKLEQDKIREQNKRDTFATIATLQNSSNHTLATIGKAAALTQIAIDTPVAVGKAMAAFPPPFNFAAAALVGAAMAAQAAQVAGIPLAEGGVVMPRPGGTHAIIGEAGQPEAVIPLDKMGGIGGNTVIIQAGAFVGNESQAYEFAVMVDRKLYELQQQGSSVAFGRRG